MEVLKGLFFWGTFCLTLKEGKWGGNKGFGRSWARNARREEWKLKATPTRSRKGNGTSPRCTQPKEMIAATGAGEESESENGKINMFGLIG